MELMVGYTVLETESGITDFKEEVAPFEFVGDYGRVLSNSVGTGYNYNCTG